MRHISVYVLSLLAIVFTACKEPPEKQVIRLVSEWSGKEIRFPNRSIFTSLGKDTVDSFNEVGKYRIISYVDSVGCMSCKLQLPRWKELIRETDSLLGNKLTYHFYFHPKDLKDLKYILRRDRFNYPVCIDLQDEFNRLNRFPSDMTFQTFLLDSLNRVVAIGNPVHNAKVKELYLSLLTGKRKDVSFMMKTSVKLDKTVADLGDVHWKEIQTATFELKNTGENLLVIHDVDTSCGCVKVEYSKEPVRPGKTLVITVTYTAEHPEQINKTISLHCNVENSPIQLQIRGNARE